MQINYTILFVILGRERLALHGEPTDHRREGRRKRACIDGFESKVAMELLQKDSSQSYKHCETYLISSFFAMDSSPVSLRGNDESKSGLQISYYLTSPF